MLLFLFFFFLCDEFFVLTSSLFLRENFAWSKLLRRVARRRIWHIKTWNISATLWEGKVTLSKQLRDGRSIFRIRTERWHWPFRCRTYTRLKERRQRSSSVLSTRLVSYDVWNKRTLSMDWYNTILKFHFPLLLLQLLCYVVPSFHMCRKTVLEHKNDNSLKLIVSYT